MALAHAHWRGQGFQVAPAISDAGFNRARIEAKFALPCGQAERPSVHRNRLHVACVLGLLQACRPAAVSRRVVLRIINTFQGIAGWAISKFSVELREVVTPFVGHFDTASAIADIAWIFRVVTSHFGVAPRFVSACRRKTVCSQSISSLFAFPATAACSETFANLDAHRNNPVTAIALKQPPCAFALRGRRSSDGNQSAESSASHVYSDRLHSPIIHVSVRMVTP